MPRGNGSAGLPMGRKSGLYATIKEDELDGRTGLAKVIKGLRQGLQDYLGEGRGNTATELLIDRIVYKAVKLSSYEAFSLNNPEHREAQHYLPMCNSLRLDLVALSQLAGQPQPPDLEDYLSGRYGES